MSWPSMRMCGRRCKPPVRSRAGEPFRTARGDRAFAAGDRILFLKNDRMLGVKNGMIGTVAQAGRGRMEVRLDGGRTVVVEESAYNNVDHGYAVTIHKAQGTTVDRAFVLASPSLDQHLAYVALSRHRDSAVLHAARRAGRPCPVSGAAGALGRENDDARL